MFFFPLYASEIAYWFAWWMCEQDPPLRMNPSPWKGVGRSINLLPPIYSFNIMKHKMNMFNIAKSKYQSPFFVCLVLVFVTSIWLQSGDYTFFMVMYIYSYLCLKIKVFHYLPSQTETHALQSGLNNVSLISSSIMSHLYRKYD